MRINTIPTVALFTLAASTMTLFASGPMTAPSAGATKAPQSTGAQPQSGRMPGRGITVCYDYAYTCGTGRMPAGNYLHADDLRNDRSVRGRTVYPNPADARYQSGDWIVTSSGHAGYVNRHGTIDHFLQVPGRIGHLYPDAGSLPPAAAGRPGGLSRNHSMDQFLNSGYRRQPNVSVEVLRRH